MEEYNKLHFKNLDAGSLAEFREGWISPSQLYLSLYERLPHIKYTLHINVEKCKKLILEKYEQEILDSQETTVCHNKSGLYTSVYVLEDEIIIGLSNRLDEKILSIHYSRFNSEKAEEIHKYLYASVREKKKGRLYLLVNKYSDPKLVSIALKNPKLNLETHYNDDLLNINDEIIKILKSKNECGLFLFHGIPGTGKSTYIRYLAHKISKKVIFISLGMGASLDSPYFMEILTENRNSVLVIEDAEPLLVSRDEEGSGSLPGLLNLTDGLLGEGLNIQIICTFNTEISRIDKALLRKGRLKIAYEFKALSKEKTEHLLSEMGHTCQPIKPMTLAEIFHLKEQGFSVENKRVIGF